MDAIASARKSLGLHLAFLLTLYGAPACAAELVGRVVDAMDAKVFHFRTAVLHGMRPDGQTGAVEIRDQSLFLIHDL